MSSRNAHAHDGDSSRKGRLSFLLNHDDEDKRLHEINSNSHDERSAPSGDGEWGGPGFFHSSFAANRGHGMDSGMISLPSGSTFQGRTPQYDRANSSKANSASESGGSEKKGVRKKRQRKFICDRCSFGFYTNSDLQKHVSSVHLLLRPYECSMCDKKFGERSNATKHFKSVHERQKNAACDQCHKVFAFRDGLVRHVRLVHENVRNFHCQYPGCGQSFKQSAHLKKHEQIHTKPRPGHQHESASGNGRSGASSSSHR